MRLLYLSFINEDIRPGYVNKITSQVKSLSRAGIESYLISRNNSGFVLREYSDCKATTKETYTIQTSGTGFRKYLRYVVSLNEYFKYCEKAIITLKPDCIYIRRIRPISPMLIRFIKRVRKLGVMVLYEYPTYPWKQEMLLYKQYVSYVLDSVLYGSLLKSISAMVCVGGICEETRCDVIRIINGIDIDELSTNSVIERIESDDLRLLSVCHYSPVHGIEKIIEGLRVYYETDRNRKVVFSLVGPLEEFASVKALVENYGIEDYVFFHGYMSRDSLNAVYNNTDVGIDAIALEIRGNCIAGSLKSREYISKGVPMVCSDMLDIIYQKEIVPEFMYVLDHNAPYLDIKKLIEWYDNLKLTPNDIKDFGLSNLTWDHCMAPVVEYINNHTK